MHHIASQREHAPVTQSYLAAALAAKGALSVFAATLALVTRVLQAARDCSVAASRAQTATAATEGMWRPGCHMTMDWAATNAHTDDDNRAQPPDAVALCTTHRAEEAVVRLNRRRVNRRAGMEHHGDTLEMKLQHTNA